jgi:hypothetical protein
MFESTLHGGQNWRPSSNPENAWFNPPAAAAALLRISKISSSSGEEDAVAALCSGAHKRPEKIEYTVPWSLLLIGSSYFIS